MPPASVACSSACSFPRRPFCCLSTVECVYGHYPHVFTHGVPCSRFPFPLSVLLCVFALVCWQAEVQSTHQDGSIVLHTRSEKYGKVRSQDSRFSQTAARIRALASFPHTPRLPANLRPGSTFLRVCSVWIGVFRLSCNRSYAL